eukprot:CAMPEP_0179431074 /NCGR_PEP_ID=MMETSP0799-20121207/16050_1 /TAXON_ID=46947 /ORGANISM="Geminigera cryophila, Strain CCMP2564" /LENGTH=83 /DNA_ID=CAMNT_0021207813 /DNA_START=142 /DNA_END=393 /DNA_ORIENTATION=+
MASEHDSLLRGYHPYEGSIMENGPQSHKGSHNRVVVGAFVVAVICSMASIVLLYFWSIGMKPQLVKDIAKNDMNYDGFDAPGN